MTKIVLVTGGTGQVGKSLLDSLAQESGIKVRALVRDAAKAKALALRGIETIVGSLENVPAVKQALLGVDTVALITAASVHAFEQASQFIKIAKDSGVRKMVRLSAIKASEDGPTDNTRQHGRTERAIRESGMTYVFLRPQYFMQNLLGSAASVIGEGKLYAGMAIAKVAMIDTRDIASAIEAAVLSEKFNDMTFELTGPASISHNAAAAELGKVLGRKVDYVAVPPEAAGEAVRAFGADDWTVQVITDYSRAYTRGFGDFTTDAVLELTGRPARPFSVFAREVFFKVASQIAPVKAAVAS